LRRNHGGWRSPVGAAVVALTPRAAAHAEVLAVAAELPELLEVALIANAQFRPPVAAELSLELHAAIELAQVIPVETIALAEPLDLAVAGQLLARFDVVDRNAEPLVADLDI